jgi:hypothetical protein
MLRRPHVVRRLELEFSAVRVAEMRTDIRNRQIRCAQQVQLAFELSALPFETLARGW